MIRLICLSLLFVYDVAAFVPALGTTQGRYNKVFLHMSMEVDNEPKRNPNRPDLPEIPGDYDWDERYAGDADWITDGVPGKVVINEIDLARQATALASLEEKWRKQRVQEEYEASINVGFVANAELLNGRSAMFFLVTGLLTEYWTGVSIPGQVEEMLRIIGVIGFDG